MRHESTMRMLLFLVGSSILAPMILPVACFSEESIVIGEGETPQVDGQVEPGEWQDAGVATFSIGEDLGVAVLYKHDGANLYLAYVYEGNDSGALAFPEVLIDPERDRSSGWLQDDWWFHVSGSDCEASGSYGVYTNCAIEHPDWSGKPNFEMSPNPPPLNEFEMRIPLGKLGIAVGDTLGIAFTVEYVPDRRGVWPAEAEVASPDTWGSARVSQEATPVEGRTWSKVKRNYRQEAVEP